MKTLSRKSSAYTLGLAGLLSAAAFTLAIAVPNPAEARIVCREGWGWQEDRCVEIRHDQGWNRDDRGWDRGESYNRDRERPHYVVGGYLPRHAAWRPLPRSHWSRYERVPVGYRYVIVGNDVLLLDHHRRVVRIYD